MAVKKADYAKIYRNFEAPVLRFDCGRMCAPLNDGEPVCCTADNAVPVVNKAEWKLLKKRTDLWHRFVPTDAAGREIVDGLAKSCLAIECKGARSCERENRSLSCRTFPFFPYITKEREFVGLAVYWTFEDRCWVISNLAKVDRKFVDEFVAAYEAVFRKDPEEFDVMRDWTATMRRVFSRWDRPIPVIARDGGWVRVLPHGGGIKKAKKKHLGKHWPFTSEKAYRRAVKEAGGKVPKIDGGLPL
ncbi:MAG: hypothetical protein GY791_11385 [Alphaproteobacteria bacterium]|nr:hypothetical protein [Alphaproteobacteria bacterium]